MQEKGEEPVMFRWVNFLGKQSSALQDCDQSGGSKHRDFKKKVRERLERAWRVQNKFSGF